MPELPDIELYLARLRERVLGEALENLRFYGPFVLRSVGVSPSDVAGKAVVSVFRLGKRIALELEGGHFILIHLMISGRLQWQNPAPSLKLRAAKGVLAAMDFSNGGRLTLVG